MYHSKTLLKLTVFRWVLASIFLMMCTASPARVLAREVDANDAYASPPSWAEAAMSGAGNDATKPYLTNARDSAGVRLVYNGRIIDLSQDAGPQPSGLASSYSSGVMDARPSLGGPTLSAVSIGNNVGINNAYNSTIVITQYNNAPQMASIGAGR